MTPKDIQITFVGMEPTESLKQYCIDKVSKYKHLWKDATSIEIFLKENVPAKGVKHDFIININVHIPNKEIRIEEVGKEMYANIDKATDILARQLKKTEEKKKFWDIKRPLKILGIGREEDVEDDKHYAYIPKIKSRKELKKLEKYEELEAIERMEMSGFNQMMFENRDSGEICMVYKREKDGYGLVTLKE
jgi:putative sigma-54 modulation protein